MNPNRSRLAAARATLDLPTSRRAAGLLDGLHQSIFKGRGHDFDDLQLYVPGDDVTDIDWKASARTGAPVVRRYLRDSQLTVVLAVDIGREMAATAAGGASKAVVAADCCALVAAVAHGRGDTVMLVAGDVGRLVRHPPSDSTEELEVLLRTLDPLFSPDAPPSDLAKPLQSLFTTLVRRSLIVIVTDEVRPEPRLDALLGRLRVRHEVMVIQVRDHTPMQPGALEVEDVDGTAPLPRYLRGRADVRRAVDEAAAQRRREVEAVLRRRTISYLLVGDGAEAPRALAQLNQRQRRGSR